MLQSLLVADMEESVSSTYEKVNVTHKHLNYESPTNSMLHDLLCGEFINIQLAKIIACYGIHRIITDIPLRTMLNQSSPVQFTTSHTWLLVSFRPD